MHDAEWDVTAVTHHYFPNTHYELCTLASTKYPEK